MYLNLGLKDTNKRCQKKGIACESVGFIRLGEYSKSGNKRFEYECFSAVLSDLTDERAATVYSLAASGGNHLVPIANLAAADAQNSGTLVAWIPRGLLGTIIRYLDDFERLVEASYDYQQEVDVVICMANEIGMLRGHFAESERKRKRILAAMTWNREVKTEQNARLTSEHVHCDSKRTFCQLLVLFSKLQVKWDLCCPQWKMWQKALDREWGVDAHTDSPLKNFERIVTHMQTRESEEKAMRS